MVATEISFPNSPTLLEKIECSCPNKRRGYMQWRPPTAMRLEAAGGCMRGWRLALAKPVSLALAWRCKGWWWWWCWWWWWWWWWCTWKFQFSLTKGCFPYKYKYQSKTSRQNSLIFPFTSSFFLDHFMTCGNPFYTNISKDFLSLPKVKDGNLILFLRIKFVQYWLSTIIIIIIIIIINFIPFRG